MVSKLKLILLIASLFCCLQIGAANSVFAEETADSSDDGIIDILRAGDITSERAHNFKQKESSIIKGGLGERGRILKKALIDEYTNYGGWIEFEMKVDPVKQNYITTKWWGSDYFENLDDHNLLLMRIDGKETGTHHYGDHTVYNIASWDAPATPNQFYFTTDEIPLSMTQGRTSVNVRIRLMGRKYDYAQNQATWYKPLENDSRGMYAYYTHTTADFTPPEGEKLGEPYKFDKVQEDKNDVEVINELKATINDKLNSYLTGNCDPHYTAVAYSQIKWCVAYQNQKFLERIIAKLDDDARTVFETGDVADWGGKYKSFAYAVYYLGRDTLAPYLDEVLDYGDGGKLKRKDAWAYVLYENMTYAMDNRRTFSNQVYYNDIGVYISNKALLEMVPEYLNSERYPRMMTEEDAMHYAYEIMGIEVMNSDNTNGTYPYGHAYYCLTDRMANGRELGNVSYYGELTFYYTELYELTGKDETIRQKLRDHQIGRAYQRYRTVDENGNNAFRIVAPISVRQDEFPLEIAYATRLDESNTLYIAAHSDCPESLAYAKQQAEDGRLLSSLQLTPYSVFSLYIPDDYEYVKNAPWPTVGDARKLNDEIYERKYPAKYNENFDDDDLIRLPFSEENPDFACTDEENGLVYIKNGDENLFMNLYIRASYGVNSSAHIFHIRPSYQKIVTARTDVKYTPSGSFFRRMNNVQSEMHVYAPPYEAANFAWGGEIQPMATNPGLEGQEYDVNISGPAHPYSGRPDLAILYYGNYFVAMNMSQYNTEIVDLPPGKTEGYDLISCETVYNGHELKPLTSIVIKYDERIEDIAPPVTPPYFVGAAGNGQVQLDWNASVDSTGYNVYRSETQGAGYELIAENIQSTGFVDNTVLNGKTYYYVITAVNEHAESRYSNELEFFVYSLDSEKPWALNDIGSAYFPAESQFNDDGSIQITGTGRGYTRLSDGKGGFYSEPDRMSYLSKVVDGYGGITVKVTPEDLGENGKAGIMLREDREDEHRYVALDIDSNGNVNLSGRYKRGDTVYIRTVNKSATWLRLERFMERFTAYISNDGVNFEKIGTYDLTSFNDNLLAGVYVSSGNDTDSAVATFSNIDCHFDIKNDKEYKLVNRKTKEVIEVDPNNCGEGAPVRLAKDSGTIEQKWRIYEANNILGNYYLYYFVNQKSGRVLEPKNRSADSGTEIVQTIDYAHDEQMWMLEYSNNGAYRIVNKAGNLAMSVQNGKLVQTEISADEAQLWDLVRVTPKYTKVSGQ